MRAPLLLARHAAASTSAHESGNRALAQVDIPPPFNLMPSPILQSTGDAALAATLNILLVSASAPHLALAPLSKRTSVTAVRAPQNDALASLLFVAPLFAPQNAFVAAIGKDYVRWAQEQRQAQRVHQQHHPSHQHQQQHHPTHQHQQHGSGAAGRQLQPSQQRSSA